MSLKSELWIMEMHQGRRSFQGQPIPALWPPGPGCAGPGILPPRECVWVWPVSPLLPRVSHNCHVVTALLLWSQAPRYPTPPTSGAPGLGKCRVIMEIFKHSFAKISISQQKSFSERLWVNYFLGGASDALNGIDKHKQGRKAMKCT